MYSYITGVVTDKRDGVLVLEAGGIGYELYMPSLLAAELEVGRAAKVFTYFSVREDGVSIFGFCDLAQKNMFLRLIGVSGVGPKVAQAILAGMSVRDLSLCITRGDADALSKIKGIGKKTGERIVLELKDKLAGELGAEGDGYTGGFEDAVAALISLGFSRTEAQGAVAAAAKNDMTVENIIYNALKNLR